MLSTKRNIHFVGVGGIGMSAIARVLIEMGHNVSGSDVKTNGVTDKLEKIGGRVFSGHRASNLPEGTDIVVYSSSIDRLNPELEEAARRRVRIMHRAGMLGEIFNKKSGIAVCGTHGKTTTTSLISVIFDRAGLDPTVMIGGEVSAFDGNARLGTGRHVIAEADESDSSFINLRPGRVVMTNIEMEHPDHFKSLGQVIASYRSFIGKMKRSGKVFYNAADRNIAKVLSGFSGRSESFGFTDAADIYAEDIRMDGFDTTFRCVYKGKALGRVKLSIPGRHNVLNALAAIMVGLDAGIDFGKMASCIKGFDGAKRRFQLRADSGGVMLIEDYAHHPTEIRAVIETCGNWKKRRVVAVFQPHRYSRTKCLAEEFGRCFDGVDKLILTDIYAASERAIPGVSAKTIYDRVRQSGLDDVTILKKDKIAGHLMRIKRPGDIILILGAGDIREVADTLSEAMPGSAARGRPRCAGIALAQALKELRRKVNGEVRSGEDLSRRTSFRIGGPADIWIEPADIKSLRNALRTLKSKDIPFFVIGNGSNLLACDGGYRGAMIHLGAKSFRSIEVKRDKIRVGAGYGLPKLVRLCCERGLAGLESMVGIPGTLGGAIFMNAGGYNNPIYRNIGSMVESLKVISFDGKVKVLRSKDLKFGYRSSGLSGVIILEALLKLGRGKAQDLVASSLRFLKMKREKHVLDLPNAGCVFKNPEGSHFTCGQMIDMLKLKGKTIGGAQISDKHANFIVNKDRASFRDVMDLVGFVRERVKENYGIELEMEVKVV
jgi:UDP-N-acetylmuramate--L-alanine ligase/UDP-N-acetylenolpyruvoylglucosamine reductase